MVGTESMAHRSAQNEDDDPKRRLPWISVLMDIVDSDLSRKLSFVVRSISVSDRSWSCQRRSRCQGVAACLPPRPVR